MIFKNEFTVHADIVDQALKMFNTNFLKAVDYLDQFNVAYLLPSNPKDYKADLKKKFTSLDGLVELRGQRMSGYIVGQRVANVITYNIAAFDKIDETDAPRFAGNLSHEVAHLYGYGHQSSFMWMDTSNRFSYDKSTRSVPYLLGFIMFCLSMNRLDIKNEVLLIARNGGVM